MTDKKQRVCLYLLSFFIPVILLIMIFAIHGIWPFGDKTVMTGDMEYQFVDYLAYLKTIVTGNNDFSYSFSKNLGGSMAGFSAYYYLSPLNIITLFFPNSMLPVAESLVIVLTAALSSLTMAVLLAEKYEADVRSVLFSVSYALCGFAATYFQLTMYSGNLILFPLIILGLLELIDKPEKKLLYIITLSCAVFFNYYSGYMICIFAFLFFVSEEIKRGPDKRAVLSFAGSSLIAVLLSAFNLLPAVLSLKGEKNSFSFGIFRTFSLTRLPRQFFACAFDGNVSTGLPNVFCGTLTVVFFLVFLLYKGFPLKERLVALAFCLFLIGNFWINLLNVAWHGFNQPIGFPYRYSYMLSFLMILCAHRAYIAVLKGPLSEKRGISLIFPLLLSIIQLADLTVNYQDVMNYYGLSSLSEYQDYLERTEERLKLCYEDSDTFLEPNELYRIEKTFRRTNNDAMQFDYAGLSHFSSSEKKEKINFMGKLGFRNNGNWSFYNESTTDFLESFLGVRYILSQFPSTPNKYERLLKDEDISVFRNNSALPLMFNTTEKIRDINYNAYNADPFLLQEAIADSLNGKENGIFRKAEVLYVDTVNLNERKEGDYTIYEKQDPDKEAWIITGIKIDNWEQNLFGFFDSDKIQNAEIFRNEISFGEYFSRYRWNIVSFHKTKKAPEITISIKLADDSLSLGDSFFYFEDRDKVDALMSEVRSNPASLTKITSSHLKGKIRVPEDGGVVTLSLPYDKGWRIYVDGKETEQKKAAGILMSFDAAPGDHSVEMKYLPQGTIPGRIISLVALVVLILCIRRDKKVLKK